LSPVSSRGATMPASAKAAGIDDEALKIGNNIWSHTLYRDSVARHQIDALLNFPHLRLLNQCEPSDICCRRDCYVPTIGSGKACVFPHDEVGLRWLIICVECHYLYKVLSCRCAEMRTKREPQGNYVNSRNEIYL